MDASPTKRRVLGALDPNASPRAPHIMGSKQAMSATTTTTTTSQTKSIKPVAFPLAASRMTAASSSPTRSTEQRPQLGRKRSIDEVSAQPTVQPTALRPGNNSEFPESLSKKLCIAREIVAVEDDSKVDAMEVEVQTEAETDAPPAEVRGEDEVCNRHQSSYCFLFLLDTRSDNSYCML